MLIANITTLAQAVEDDGNSNLLWTIVGVLAVIALLIFIVGGRWRR